MDEMMLKLFEAFGGWDNSPEEKAAMEAAQPVMEQVEKKLTFEEFEDFWSAAMDVGPPMCRPPLSGNSGRGPV